MIFTSGCARNDLLRRLTSASRTTAESNLLSSTTAELDKPKPLPKDCYKQERSGVKPTDRLDVALWKTDSALYQANKRVLRCAAHHDKTTGAGK